MAGTETRSRAVWALLAVIVAVGLWNAARYPPGNGYDASHHLVYATGLVEHGSIPGKETRGEYYSPPGFYAVAGAAWWVGKQLGLGEPARLALALNVLYQLATALLLLALVRELWPRRPVLHLAALGFFAFLPVTTKAAAMFHPEPLDLLVATAGLYLGARMLNRRAFGARAALATGVVFGVGMLVRQFTAYTAAAVGVAFLATRSQEALRALALVVLAAVVVAGPWYVRQAVRYSNPVFAQESSVAKPLLERRPASFYVGTGLPQSFTEPWRPHFVNRAVPTTYSELWGDYFGAFAWDGRGTPSSAERTTLRAQNGLGVLPTLLALAGWLALLAVSLRRLDPPRLAVALVPLFGFLGYAYFTIAYPTPDGDVLKATYMLTTATAWAAAFGLAVERLARRRVAAWGLAAVLVLSAAVDLRFLVY